MKNPIKRFLQVHFRQRIMISLIPIIIFSFCICAMLIYRGHEKKNTDQGNINTIGTQDADIQENQSTVGTVGNPDSSVSESPDAGTDNSDESASTSTVTDESSGEEKHLDFYDEFDTFNTSRDDFKDFILSEVWIDQKPYYQLLNEEKDVKLLVDEKQENAVIYHSGKSMKYYMWYLITGMPSYAQVRLLDITGDGKEELIIIHAGGGGGFYFADCSVINLETMTEFMIDDYIYELSSRVKVEPLKQDESDTLTCKVTDTVGNTYYAVTAGIYDKLEDYAYVQGSSNPNYNIWIDYDKKCLGVSISMLMDQHNAGYLGSVDSYMVYNPSSGRFELSEEYEVHLEQQIYYKDERMLPKGTCNFDMRDEMNGWAVTADGSLLSTTDGWKTNTKLYDFTWNKEKIPVTSIDYIDNTLFAGGVMPIGGKAVVFRSTDGGNTWKSGYLDPSDMYGGAGEVFISFTDRKNGYLLCCGDPACGMMTKVLYSTADGGKTFRKISDLSTVISGYPTGLKFTEDGKGFITCTYHGDNYSYLYSSDDNGLTWRPVILQEPEDFHELTEGYMDGYPPKFWGKDGIVLMKYVCDTNISYRVYATSDGGESWSYYGYVVIPFFIDYSFADMDKIFFSDTVGALMLKEIQKD